MGNFKGILLAVLTIGVGADGIAQHDPYSGPQWHGSKNKHIDTDSTTLLYAFRQGQLTNTSAISLYQLVTRVI